MENVTKEGTQKPITPKIGTGVVGNELIHNMPDPQPNVVDHGEAVTQKEGPTLKDKLGRAFDSALHKLGADGKPELTPKGYLKVNPGKGRKSNIGGLDKPQEALAVPEPNYEACGITAAHSIFFLAQGLGGQEWEPDQKETVYMSNAWTEYFRAKGIGDIPPGVMLMTALISYAAPRFSRPETRTRCKRIHSWLAGKFSRKTDHGAHVDSRNDGKRENNISDATSQGIPATRN